jgi:hypothetical protein
MLIYSKRKNETRWSNPTKFINNRVKILDTAFRTLQKIKVMKTIFQTITALIFTAALSISCKDKENAPADLSAPSIETSGPAETNTDTTGNSPDMSGGGATTTTSTTTEGSGDGSDGRTNSTAVNRSKNIQTNSSKKKVSGYSAPDGTAAENHDGDMYTKHDTTRMPSGVPIK